MKNDVSLINGTYSRVYADVCDDCLKRLANVIDDKFPRNKIALKKEEKVITGTPV